MRKLENVENGPNVGAKNKRKRKSVDANAKRKKRKNVDANAKR